MKTMLEEILSELDAETNVWKMRPIIVNSRGLHRCWAGALLSWSKSSNALPKFSSIDQIVQFVRSRAPGVVDAAGRLIGEQGLAAIRDLFDLKLDPSFDQAMTADYLSPKLRKSYVMIVFQADAGDDLQWHSVLVYGVDQRSLCYMDPTRATRLCTRYWDFALNDPFRYVLWKE